MIVNCAAGSKIRPLAAGYYYISGTNNYILTPELKKVPADDLANKIADCKNNTDNIYQRDQKIHLMCNGNNGHHIHTFIIGDRVVDRDLLTLGAHFVMAPDGKVITGAGVYDVDTGKPVHEFTGYSAATTGMYWQYRRHVGEGADIVKHNSFYHELAERGYIVARKSTPPAAVIVYDYNRGVETRFDGDITISMYIDPVEFVIASADKFMLIRSEPTISKMMPPPKITAAVAGDAIHIIYNKNPFETYTRDMNIADVPGHPLARNLELLYEIIKDAIDREPHLALHIAEKADNVVVTIRFLQKYAPDPLVIELTRVERDRIDVIGAKVDWLLSSLPKY